MKYLLSLFCVISLLVVSGCSDSEKDIGTLDLSGLIVDGRCPQGMEAVYGTVTKTAINCKVSVPVTAMVSSEAEIKQVVDAGIEWTNKVAKMKKDFVSGEMVGYSYSHTGVYAITGSEESDFHRSIVSVDNSESGNICRQNIGIDCNRIDLYAKVDGNEILMTSYPTYEDVRMLVTNITKVGDYILYHIYTGLYIFDMNSEKLIPKVLGNEKWSFSADKEYLYACARWGLNDGSLSVLNTATSEVINILELVPPSGKLEECDFGRKNSSPAIYFSVSYSTYDEMSKTTNVEIKYYIYTVKDERIEELTL